MSHCNKEWEKQLSIIICFQELPNQLVFHLEHAYGLSETKRNAIRFQLSSWTKCIVLTTFVNPFLMCHSTIHNSFTTMMQKNKKGCKFSKNSMPENIRLVIIKEILTIKFPIEIIRINASFNNINPTHNNKILKLISIKSELSITIFLFFYIKIKLFFFSILFLIKIIFLKIISFHLKS